MYQCAQCRKLGVRLTEAHAAHLAWELLGEEYERMQPGKAELCGRRRRDREVLVGGAAAIHLHAHVIVVIPPPATQAAEREDHAPQAMQRAE